MDRNNSSESEAYLFATQLATASEFQAALKSAIELDLLELIKNAGPDASLSAADLASRIPTTNPAAPGILDRILRLLAAYSVLNSTLKSLPDGSVERLYSLAPVCEFLTKNEDGVSLAPLLLLFQDNVFKASGDKLNEAFIDGGTPFDKAFGMSMFQYTETNQRYNNIFNEAMSNHSTLVMKKVLETYHGFEGLKSMVDVGGGIGATLNMIVSKHPSIKGINFDLPHVLRRVQACNKIGVEHVGGDMFVSVPKGEAVFMKCICHDWSDEICVKLLRNCYRAIPENGKVILVEMVLPNGSDDKQLIIKTVLQLDIAMMAHTERGRERTEMEFQALANEAGFKEFHKVCCAHNYWVMELMK